MAQIHKYRFNREGRAGPRTLVFVGQHPIYIQTGNLNHAVEIEIEGETAAFVISLTADEARKVRGYLDKMGY